MAYKLNSYSKTPEKLRDMIKDLTANELQELSEMLAGNDPFNRVRDVYNNLYEAEKDLMVSILNDIAAPVRGE